MPKWEYICTRIRIAQIASPKTTFWEWVEDQPDGSLVQGMNLILNNYGDKEWELINLIPAFWEGTKSESASADVQTYRAVFKRQVR